MNKKILIFISVCLLANATVTQDEYDKLVKLTNKLNLEEFLRKKQEKEDKIKKLGKLLSEHIICLHGYEFLIYENSIIQLYEKGIFSRQPISCPN